MKQAYQVLIAKRDGTTQVYRDSGLDRYSLQTAEMLAQILRARYPKRTITVEKAA